MRLPYAPFSGGSSVLNLLNYCGTLHLTPALGACRIYSKYLGVPLNLLTAEPKNLEIAEAGPFDAFVSITFWLKAKYFGPLWVYSFIDLGKFN